MIVVNAATILPSLTLIFNSLIISVRRYARRYVGILLLSLLIFFPHIITNTQFKHVTSKYYHGCYVVFEFAFNGTCFHGVINI